MVRSNTDLLATAGIEVSPFGILGPATTVFNENSDYWTSGLTYEINDAGIVVENHVIFGGDQQDGVVVVDNSDNPENFKTYFPFDVRASIQVSTFGNTPASVQANAENALSIVEQKAIEAEFWNGDIAKLLTSDNDNRYLASTATIDLTPTPGTAVKPRYGQAILEGAFGSAPTGAEGVIHAPREVASVLKVEKDGGALRTNLGTKVVSGAGYSRRGPDGTLASAGKYWMYATGPVSVRRGSLHIVPEKVNQAVDVRVNTIKYYVDRPVAVTWSTTHSYAVLIDLSLDYA
jgi:hypothetical protein